MTTLVRWEPFRRLGTLHSEMSRLMNGVLEGTGALLKTGFRPSMSGRRHRGRCTHSTFPAFRRIRSASR